jgi:hypothetical protein
MALKPECSSPHSQHSATGLYPESVESTPPTANLPKIRSDPILPSTPWPSKWSLSLELSHQTSSLYSYS